MGDSVVCSFDVWASMSANTNGRIDSATEAENFWTMSPRLEIERSRNLGNFSATENKSFSQIAQTSTSYLVFATQPPVKPPAYLGMNRRNHWLPRQSIDWNQVQYRKKSKFRKTCVQNNVNFFQCSEGFRTFKFALNNHQMDHSITTIAKQNKRSQTNLNEWTTGVWVVKCQFWSCCNINLDSGGSCWCQLHHYLLLQFFLTVCQIKIYYNNCFAFNDF